MNQSNWRPFYERILWPGANSFIAKITFSAALGIAFLSLHLFVRKSLFFSDWSWFLALVITAAMMCVFYATHTLRGLLPEIEIRLGQKAKLEFKLLLAETLSDKKLIQSGMFFGTANCLMAYLFGYPYSSSIAPNISIGCGYFMAGFVCGMAVQGIYSVTILMHKYAEDAQDSYDFTASDNCGGTGYLGAGIYVFSLVSLIVSILISIYIQKTTWAHATESYFVLAKWFWIIFPYLISICALIAPAIPINVQLMQYKRTQDASIQQSINNIRQQLQTGTYQQADVKTLREEYAYQLGIRDQLHKMRTWPFSLYTNVEYAIAITVSVATSVSSSYDWVSKIINPH